MARSSALSAMLLSVLVALFLTIALVTVDAAPITLLPGALDPPKFLIVTSPKDGKISYLALLPGTVSSNAKTKPRTLTEKGLDENLKTPHGIAVDTERNQLYVADPGAKKILRYFITFAWDAENSYYGNLGLKFDKAIVENVDCYDLTLDGSGDLYFVDASTGIVSKFIEGKKPEPIYQRSLLPTTPLSQTKALFTDNWKLIWGNSQAGAQFGSVVAAPIKKPNFEPAGSTPPGMSVLDAKWNRVFGVCGSGGKDVFFTVRDTTETGGLVKLDKNAKTAGSSTAEVDNGAHLTEVGHCAWDRDSSIFVAAGSKGVLAYAGALSTAAPSVMNAANKMTEANQVLDFDGATGIAVFHGSGENSAAFGKHSLSVGVFVAAIIGGGLFV